MTVGSMSWGRSPCPAARNPNDIPGAVTTGVVTATGRTITEAHTGSGPGPTVPDAIQTSAATNAGDNGGALVDLSGTVVGIPIFAGQDPPGIGFAISANLIIDIGGQIITHGHVTTSHRGALGVFNVTSHAKPVGVEVATINPGGPAAAGIHPHDPGPKPFAPR